VAGERILPQHALPGTRTETDNPLILTVPWSKTPHRRHRDVIAPEGSSRKQVLPIRSDTRVKLVTAVARGRQWLSEVEAGGATIDAIAAREACSKRHVNMTISLAFLAPGLVIAAVEGRLPHGIGVVPEHDLDEVSPVRDRDLFEAVQLKLAEQHNGYRAARAGSEALLTGRIFDDRGNRMSPSHSRKGGARYGYYVSSALIQGQPEAAGSMARVPAAKVEAVIVEAVRRHVGPDAPVDTTELITTHVRQIEVRRLRMSM
jgi:hypothetical protein